MKLYHYDHCPYCVKARMIFGLKNISVELQALANDDEKTPIEKVGKKMVPILVKDNGESMAESLDIIEYIDGLGERRVGLSKNDIRLNNWLKETRNYHYALAMPRWVKMGLEEFQTPSAVEYFTIRKEAYIGSFSKHLEQSDQLIEMAHQHLKELELIIQGDTFVWGSLNIDDFHLFASLRCLTTTKGIVFPKSVNNYMNNLSEASRVELHWEKSI